jgi:uncharacterized protein (TIGR03382 family)
MKQLLLVVGGVLLAGFHQPATFEAAAGAGGGNRIYFDGSPRQKGYDCTLCHTDAPKQIRAQLELTPAIAGAYQPGMTYTIAVTLVGEHAGFGTADNQNGFVAELVDDGGQPAGTLASPDVSKVVTIDDGAVVSGEAKDTTTWQFAWTAPAAGRGAVTLHVAMVDGNGAASASVPQNDPGGDDVAISSERMCESAPDCPTSAAPPRAESKAAGCSAGGSASPLVALLVLVAVLARSHRRAWLTLALTGCFAPSVPGDCPDRVCGVGGTDAGSSCKEDWVCTPWQAPQGSDQATRTCVDQNNVGTTTCKPATTAMLPSLDFDYYQCRVHPIFQRGCGQMGCHGTETGHAFRIYARGRWRNDELVPDRGSCLTAAGTPMNLNKYGSGTVMCEGWYPHTQAEWNKSFDSARSFMLDVTNPDDSLLLREPATGGLPHARIKLFAPGDASYQTLHDWLGGATLGTTCNTGAN